MAKKSKNLANAMQDGKMGIVDATKQTTLQSMHRNALHSWKLTNIRMGSRFRFSQCHPQWKYRLNLHNQQPLDPTSTESMQTTTRSCIRLHHIQRSTTTIQKME